MLRITGIKIETINIPEMQFNFG